MLLVVFGLWGVRRGGSAVAGFPLAFVSRAGVGGLGELEGNEDVDGGGKNRRGVCVVEGMLDFFCGGGGGGRWISKEKGGEEFFKNKKVKKLRMWENFSSGEKGFVYWGCLGKERGKGIDWSACCSRRKRGRGALGGRCEKDWPACMMTWSERASEALRDQAKRPGWITDGRRAMQKCGT